MNILSIQSHVAYGHVGNSSAVFPLQRLGAEVWPIHTVQFSNHTGYGDWTGQVFDGEMISQIMTGIAARGVLSGCDAVISGYMGSTAIGEAIVQAVRHVRAANPRALWCCDPVMGDVGRGMFVRPGLPEFIRDVAVPLADIVTPNHFELEHLTARRVTDAASLRAALAVLHGHGPRTILVTSLMLDDTPPDRIDMAASTGDHVFRLETPRLDLSVNGAGDAIAALFTFHLLSTGSAALALARAGASVHGLLRRTRDAGSREILTVAAQEEFVAPSHCFPVGNL
jgi:pyridoxine kinase